MSFWPKMSKFCFFEKFQIFKNFEIFEIFIDFFENVEKSKNLKIFGKIEILKFLAKMTLLIFIFQNAPDFFLVNGFWNSKK